MENIITESETVYVIQHTKNGVSRKLPFRFNTPKQAEYVIDSIKKNETKEIGDHKTVFHLIKQERVLVTI